MPLQSNLNAVVFQQTHHMHAPTPGRAELRRPSPASLPQPAALAFVPKASGVRTAKSAMCAESGLNNRWMWRWIPLNRHMSWCSRYVASDQRITFKGEGQDANVIAHCAQQYGYSQLRVHPACSGQHERSRSPCVKQMMPTCTPSRLLPCANRCVTSNSGRRLSLLKSTG